MIFPDTAIDAARLLVSDSTLDATIRDAVESQRNATLNIVPSGSSIYDNTSSLASLLPRDASPNKHEPSSKVLAITDKLKTRISEGRGSETDKEALALIESLSR